MQERFESGHVPAAASGLGSTASSCVPPPHKRETGRCQARGRVPPSSTSRCRLASSGHQEVCRSWGSSRILDERAEPGKVLCVWGDAGGGPRDGKYADGRFCDELVTASAQSRDGAPAIAWVTCVPSLRRPDLLPDFARGLQQHSGFPSHPASRRRTSAQSRRAERTHSTGAKRGRRVAARRRAVASGPVLLVDDVVDSRTLTVSAGLAPRWSTNGLAMALAKRRVMNAGCRQTAGHPAADSAVDAGAGRQEEFPGVQAACPTLAEHRAATRGLAVSCRGRRSGEPRFDRGWRTSAGAAGARISLEPSGRAMEFACHLGRKPCGCCLPAASQGGYEGGCSRGPLWVR